MATATTLEVETAHRNNQAVGAEAGEIPIGGTIRNIAAAPRMETEERRTGSVVRHVETLCLIVRPVPGNRLADRAEICLAIGPAERVLVTELVAQGLATERAGAERIGSEAGMCRAAVAETEMPLEEVPGAQRVTTDRARAPAAAAVLRAWDLEEVEVVAAGVGVGKGLGRGKEVTGARI